MVFTTKMKKKIYFIAIVTIILLWMNGCKTPQPYPKPFNKITINTKVHPLYMRSMNNYEEAFLSAQKSGNTSTSERAMFEQKSIAQMASSLKTFLKAYPNFNQDTVFIINMKIISGLNRFFVYDYVQNKVIDQGLVSHGEGSDAYVGRKWRPKFSNRLGSEMTSLGKYAIGRSYSGAYGKSYLLYGLDKTNSNAMRRNIVLHAFKGISEKQQYNNLLVRSYGCPMVSLAFFKRLEKMIDTSPHPIVLYIDYIPF